MTRTGQLELRLAHDDALDHAAEWAGQARTEIVARLLHDRSQKFTAEDVRRWVGDPPGDGAAMGALFRSLANEGWIEACGYDTAKRPDAHGRVLRVWRGRFE